MTIVIVLESLRSGREKLFRRRKRPGRYLYFSTIAMRGRRRKTLRPFEKC
jgi:hypothetical protein